MAAGAGGRARGVDRGDAAGRSERGLVAELAKAGRHVVERGLVVGSGGNLSARVPGSDRLLVTGAGTWLDALGPDCFARVRLADGQPVSDGRGPTGASRRPSTELALHLAIYRSRPDVTAVVHLHPLTSILLDALGERIRLVTTDHAAYVRRVAVTAFHPPGTPELADVAGRAVADGTNCVLLPHHGCAVVADSVEMALRRAVNLEEAARLTYRALVLTGGLAGRSVPECPVSYTDDATV
jgi:ribulose-5-phosphate 4-epimerase/fuculose-1-phosphate aldolase